MKPEELGFHDSVILEVVENTKDDILDFILKYPIDWDNNKFETKTLRFTDYLIHHVNHYPCAGYPTILSIELIEDVDTYKFPLRKIKMVTTSGDRVIVYKDAELLKK